MGRSRVSMRGLAFTVVLIAVDFAAVRLGIAAMTGSADLMLAIFGALPLANIVAIVGYRILSRRADARPFLAGFALTGLLVLFAWLNACLTIEDGLLQTFSNWMAETVHTSRVGRHIVRNVEDPFERSICSGVVFVAFYLTMAVPPQLLVCLLGGRVASRLAASRRPVLPA